MAAGQFARISTNLFGLMLTWASSRQAIKKYINANNDLTGMTEAAFNKHISRALEVGEGKVFEFPKGRYSRGGVFVRRVRDTSFDT